MSLRSRSSEVGFYKLLCILHDVDEASFLCVSRDRVTGLHATLKVQERVEARKFVYACLLYFGYSTTRPCEHCMDVRMLDELVAQGQVEVALASASWPMAH